MSERSGAFWDRLIVDWVAVVVGAFVLQGFWFTLLSAIPASQADLAQTMSGVTSKLFIPWGIAILGGLTWSVFRAVDALNGKR